MCKSKLDDFARNPGENRNKCLKLYFEANME